MESLHLYSVGVKIIYLFSFFFVRFSLRSRLFVRAAKEKKYTTVNIIRPANKSANSCNPHKITKQRKLKHDPPYCQHLECCRYFSKRTRPNVDTTRGIKQQTATEE